MDGVELRRSRRRTLGLEVTREGRVIVRAPLRASAATIERFVREHEDWIARAQARQRARLEAHPEPDAARQAELIRRAREELPPKVAHYAQKMGLNRQASASRRRARGSVRAAHRTGCAFRGD